MYASLFGDQAAEASEASRERNGLGVERVKVNPENTSTPFYRFCSKQSLQ